MHTHPHMITHRDCTHTHTHTGGVGEDCAMYKKEKKKLNDTNKKRDNLELNINNK